MAKTQSAVKIETVQQLQHLDIGQVVEKSERVGVYGGLGWVQTCSCSECPNTTQLPMIIYHSNSGGIEIEVIFSLGKSGQKRIFGVSAIYPISDKDDNYGLCEKLLDNLSKE